MAPSQPDLTPIKKLFFEQALAFGEVAVRFFPASPGVEIPPFLDPQALQVFLYGLDQPKPIPDLNVTERGISATLSFDCQPHKTFVPWAAVVAMGGLEFGIVFPVPAVRIETDPEPGPAQPERPRPALSVVR